MDPLSYALFVSGVFVLGGFVKGVIGMGLPTVAVGLLGLALAPAQAAALMVVPSLLANAWQAFAGPHLRVLLRRLWAMQLMICVGTWITAGRWTDAADARLAGSALGLALVAYALYGLANRKLHIPARLEPWLSPLVGLLTGLVSGATGIFVMPSVPYLQALLPDKDQLVQALGLTFLVGTVAVGVGLAGAGQVDRALAVQSVLALAPALVGMWVGQVVRGRVSAVGFRKWFFWGMLVLGAHLAARSLH